MFPVGHVLNDTYRIERLLGKGGMAYVYEVSHVRLPRRFAFKVITAPSAQSSEFVLRFRREAEILASMDHPNLVNVLDWNTTQEGQPYLVMELLSGEDLAECLRRTGALPLKVALSIFVQIAEALNYAHGRGIVHRDLKPANIFLCKNGVVPYFAKVLDFGIAKSAQHGAALITDHMALMGTPAYMAPEQARGNLAALDARADQFALALVLYEMLSGKSAFHRRGEAPMLTMYRVLTEDPEPLDDSRMNQVLGRALCKDPEQRYPTLSAFVDAVVDCSPEPIELPERTERVSVTPANADPGGEAAAPTPAAKTPPSLLTNRGGELLPHGPRRPSLMSWTVLSGTALALTLILMRFAFFPAASSQAPRPADLREELDGAASSAADAVSEPPQEDLGTPEAAPDLAAQPVLQAPESPESGEERPRRRPPKPRPTGRPTLYLRGVGEETLIAKVIRRCVYDTFGSSLRRMIGTVIELGRTDRLRVSSRLSFERGQQLDECLSNLQQAGESLPPQVDVKIVEEK